MPMGGKRAIRGVIDADKREMGKPVPTSAPRRGLEGLGFTPAESRAIHKAAGNDNPPPSRSLNQARENVEEKARRGRTITNEDLY